MSTTRKFVLLTLIASVGLMAGPCVTSQEKGDLIKGVTFEQSKNDVQSDEKTTSATPPEQSTRDLSPLFSCDSIGNQTDKEKDVHDACLSALKENFTYESERLKHRKWVFRFQLVATNISFVIVIVMVAFGLRFAYVQFSREFPRVLPATAAIDLGGRAENNISTTTDIEVSLARVKISSSILGVVILGLAMGFFYLYIRFVFPIQGVI